MEDGIVVKIGLDENHLNRVKTLCDDISNAIEKYQEAEKDTKNVCEVRDSQGNSIKTSLE